MPWKQVTYPQKALDMDPILVQTSWEVSLISQKLQPIFHHLWFKRKSGFCPPSSPCLPLLPCGSYSTFIHIWYELSIKIFFLLNHRFPYSKLLDKSVLHLRSVGHASYFISIPCTTSPCWLIPLPHLPPPWFIPYLHTHLVWVINPVLLRLNLRFPCSKLLNKPVLHLWCISQVGSSNL